MNPKLHYKDLLGTAAIPVLLLPWHPTFLMGVPRRSACVNLTCPACELEGLGAMSGLRMGLVLPGYPDLEPAERLVCIQ